MIYVGIDVAKDKHDCHIMRDDGEVIVDNYTFENSREGFLSFDELVKRSKKRKEEVKIGLEYTGHYSHNLIENLKAKGYPVLALNPLKVNLYRKSKSLRNTKTDKSDARYIAEVTSETEIEKRRYVVNDIHVLRSLTRYRYRILKTVQSTKNRYRRVLQVVFPEFEKHFNVNYRSAIELIGRYSSPREVLAADRDALIRNLNKMSYGRYGKRADELIEAAESSIGVSNAGDAYELKHIAKHIAFLESEVAMVEEKLRVILDRLHSPILSIPGIGVTTGATILAEIGNIKNFENSAKLLAFVGCEPTIYQSGKYVLTRTPMVKKGSKYLRNAIFQATKSAYVIDPTMRAYVDRKRAEGKHFFVALSHGMKKMVRVVFAVLRSGKDYVAPDIPEAELKKEVAAQGCTATE
ncbi:MAG: IS110 family transposase [Clostridia bacterium]|nr:IS110 family transposase [Clostridia bacterium]